MENGTGRNAPPAGGEVYNKERVERLLAATGDAQRELLERAGRAKAERVGRTVHLRGLIEMSNVCSKNCLYCGIRAGNAAVERYDIPDDEILSAARWAHEQGFGSLALQGGERTGADFARRVERLLRGIKELSGGELGVTLSLGEQDRDTYLRWRDAGAHRYLLRVEASNPGLYRRIHPADSRHDYHRRVECLGLLRDCGYQVGTGVMVGLPFQTLGDLADDLLFMRRMDVDMIGMGPYIEHHETPLCGAAPLPPATERVELTLKMLAVARLMMPDVNMVASTAMQSLDPAGRERALMAGANILMPNITPRRYRDSYKLYENKPGVAEDAQESLRAIEALAARAGARVAYRQWGDSRHFAARQR